MSRKRQFGELELEIAKVVKSKEWSSVRDVMVALGESDSYTTIMTVMNRLVEKNELIRMREGKRFLYQVVKEKKKPFGLLERLKQKLFGGQSLAMINYLIESDHLSEKDLEKIQQMIEDKKSE